jgi:tetratricopeptide (TPR) repeat protein
MAVLSKVLEEILSEQMQVILAHLSARAFIVPRADGAAGEYAFRHVLTSDAIYSTLLRRERSELHGQVGQAIEALYHDRLDEQVYLLARHYSWSAMLDKALKYLIQAGEKAARDYLNLQARDYYQQALELLPRVEHARSQASQLYTGLGDVLVFVGEYDQARERYQAAEALIDSDDPSRIAASTALRRKISTTYERQGDFDQALDHLDAAQYLLDGSELPLPGERVKNLNNIGWIHFRRGELDQANQYLCEALALAEEMHQPEIIASVYNRLGGIYFAKGDLDQAANFVRRSLSLREAMGDIGAVARSYNNLGLLEWKQGRWNAALDSFLRSADLNATLGDIEATIHLEGNIGILYTDRGDLGQAKKYLEGCLEKARQIGHGYLEAAAHLQLARYWLAAKNWQKTLAYCEQSETIFQSLGSTENAADLHWCKGEAWLGSGDVEKADRICQEILALMRAGELSSQPSTELGRVVRLQGKVAQARRQFDLAAQLFDESLRHFRALDDRLELGRTIVLQAFLAIAQGHQEIVPKLISESRRIFAELGARLDLRELDDL